MRAPAVWAAQSQLLRARSHSWSATRAWRTTLPSSQSPPGEQPTSSEHHFPGRATGWLKLGRLKFLRASWGMSRPFCQSLDGPYPSSPSSLRTSGGHGRLTQPKPHCVTVGSMKGFSNEKARVQNCSNMKDDCNKSSLISACSCGAHTHLQSKLLCRTHLHGQNEGQVGKWRFEHSLRECIWKDWEGHYLGGPPVGHLSHSELAVQQCNISEPPCAPRTLVDLLP